MSVVELTIEVPPGNRSLYARIAAGIRRALSEQRVEPGAELMTSQALATALSVNVNTALRAYGMLADEGLIELRRGHRPVVRASPEHARLHELAEQLVDEAARLGVTRGEMIAILLQHA